MTDWVFEYVLAGQPQRTILVRVSPKSGGHELDLDLLATDREDIYRTKVRHRKIDTLRHSSYDGTPEEWVQYMKFAFCFPKDPKFPPALQQSLEIVCKLLEIESKPVLAITLQTSVEDIKHKLGTVELPWKQKHDHFDMFAWTSQVVEVRDRLVKQFEEEKRRADKADATIESLRAELDELIKAKDQHETQMLAKFALLLNEKKLQIRTQQRQLAEQNHPTSIASATSAAGTRKRKRNHGSEPVPVESESESDGFEAMNVDDPADVQTDRGSEASDIHSSMSELEATVDAEPKRGHSSRTTEPPSDAPSMVGNATVSDVGDDAETESEDDDEL